MATRFNYDHMQKHMKNLDADFAYFALTLKKANDLVNDFVNVSSASSLYGEKAKKVLSLWNQNASTFGDFYQNFENWSALMINASNTYHKFEESVFSTHRTTGDLSDGVAASRESARTLAETPAIDREVTATNPNGIFTLPDGSTIQYMMDENNNTYAIITKNGVCIKRIFHEDGTYTDYDISEISLEEPTDLEILGEPMESGIKDVYEEEYLQTNAVSLDQLDLEAVRLGNEEVPSVLYLAPGQSIFYGPALSLKINRIEGGYKGLYLVYNPEKQAYFKCLKLLENGGYVTSNTETIGSWIPKDQLLSSDTTLQK